MFTTPVPSTPGTARSLIPTQPLQMQKPQSVAQILIEQIANAYTHEEADRDGIYYWPDPLPTPVYPHCPNPLVLFRPDEQELAQMGETKWLAVVPMTMQEVLLWRKREQARPSMQIPIGLIDKPELQQCAPFVVDLHGSAGALTGGPLLIAGAQHSGKATTVQTLLHWLCTRFLPEQFRCAIIDPLQEMESVLDLPHFRADDGTLMWSDGESEESIQRIASIFMSEIQHRREEFPALRHHEATLAQLWSEGVQIPQLLLIINNYQCFAERPASAMLLKKLALAVIDARIQGVYLVVTTAEIGSRYLPVDLLGKFRTRIGLLLNEQQRFDLFGRVLLVPDPVPGRGLVLTPERDIYQIQIAVPIPHEERRS